jgi:hypothetical protein
MTERIQVNETSYSLIRWSTQDGCKNETWVRSRTEITSLQNIEAIDLETDTTSTCKTTKDKRCTKTKVAGGFILNQGKIALLLNDPSISTDSFFLLLKNQQLTFINEYKNILLIDVKIRCQYCYLSLWIYTVCI